MWGRVRKGPESSFFFSVSDRELCGVSKYTGKLGILEGERQTGENKMVCFAKVIFK